MRILVLTSIYVGDDIPKEFTPIVHYFTSEWVKMGHEVIVVHNLAYYPRFFYLISFFFSKLIASLTGTNIPKKRLSNEKEYLIDYVKLQQNAYVVLSDSGTISEESAMMGFSAVSIRTSTERPEAVDAGTIVLGGVSKDSILNAIEITKGLSIDSNTQLPWEYQIINTSERIIKVIQSYTPIVNKVIWDK